METFLNLELELEEKQHFHLKILNNCSLQPAESTGRHVSLLYDQKSQVLVFSERNTLLAVS